MMELEVNELLFVNETDRRWVRLGYLITARVIILSSSIDTTILMQYYAYYSLNYSDLTRCMSNSLLAAKPSFTERGNAVLGRHRDSA